MIIMEDRFREGQGGGKSCGKVDVPTADEISALQAMRCIKERVRHLRSRLSAISSGRVVEKPGEKETLEEEIKRLRSEWEIREQERKRAARERMILLGHEEPSTSAQEDHPPIKAGE